MPTGSKQTHNAFTQGLPMVMRLAGLWLITVAWCQIAGWGLSGIGSLNAYGYLASGPFLLASAILFWRHTSSRHATPCRASKWLRRVKSSPALIAWCAVCALVFIGAIAYAPSNYDAVTYRLPRLLFWLQENRWHWIDGLDHRQNVSGVGHEWMMAPFISLTRSDRALFLINFIPFLLLPGLFFVAACGLGIRKRVARWWMWIWPMAYGITLQAGSIGNDLLPASLALASLAFTSQARRSNPIICLFLSALAAAAMTGAKATSMPLGLPLGIYWIWTAWNTIDWRGMIQIAIPAVGLILPCSFIPLAIACIHYTSHWSGNPNNQSGAEAKHPMAGIIGNSIEIAGGLVQPPILPWSKKINDSIKDACENQYWHKWTKEGYPLYNISLGGEVPIEEHSGMGIAVTALLLIVACSRFLKKQKYAIRLSTLQWAMHMATSVALLAFMSKMGTGGMARLSMPYFPMLIFCFLFGIKRQPFGHTATNHLMQLMPAACLLPALILNPNRPLFPTDYLAHHPSLSSAYKERIQSVYQAYRNRSSILAPLLKNIPRNDTIGFAGDGNHSALGLFKPYGGRKVISFMPSSKDRADWIIGTTEGIEKRMGMPLEEWENQNEFRLVNRKDIVSLVAVGPETWLIYRRKDSL